MDLIIDAVRWMLWLLVKGGFFIMDSIYSMVKTVVAFDIGKAEGLWDWWSGLCAFLIFFVFVRIIAYYLHCYIDEDKAIKSNPVSIFFRIGIICITIAFIPIITPYFTAIGSHSIEKFDTIFVTGNTFDTKVPTTGDPKVDEEIKKQYQAYAGMPSKLFMDGISNGKYPLYNMININETEFGLDHWFDGVPVLGGVFNVTSAIFGQDGDYVYLPDTVLLIFLLIESLCAAYLFFMIGIQIVQRIFSIGMKILISPIPISGLVNPEDQSFGIWAKLLAGDMITNFFQFMMMKFVLMVSSSTSVIAMGPTIQPILFLGGMLCVLVGPGAIAQIIGGDGMGVNNTMQAMNTMRSMAHTGKTALSFAGGGLAFASAAGIYGSGRILGGKSLSGGDVDTPTDSGVSSAIHGGYDSFNGTSAGGLPKALSEEPAGKQEAVAEKLGLDNSGMNKGEASIALEKAGIDRSYWHGTGTDSQGLNNIDGGANGTIAADMGNYNQANGAVNDLDANEKSRYTREGSYARRFADDAKMSAEEKGRPGIRNVAVCGAQSLYQASANRLFGKRTVMRRGQYIQRNTRAQSMANFTHAMRNVAKTDQSSINDPVDDIFQENEVNE